MPRNNMDVLCLLQEHGAILEGHFVMPSGFHSQTYIQTSLLLQHPHLAQRIAGALSDKFTKKADVVMALTPSDSVLAQEVARARGVRAIFASRADDGEMILKHNFTVKEGENVLIVDDVISTGESLHALEALVNQAGGEIVGRMAILAEGEAQARTDLIYLEKLPVFNAKGEIIG